MRLLKWITFALLAAIVGLFIYQNLGTFNSLIPFSLDLYIHEAFPWSHHLYTIIGVGAALGFLLGLMLMLKPYLRLRRMLFEERQEKQQLKQQQPDLQTAPARPAAPAPDTSTAGGAPPRPAFPEGQTQSASPDAGAMSKESQTNPDGSS